MTDDELKESYADLLIIQYHDLPKARATVKALVDGVIQNQILFAIRDGFDIETAIGVQLDTLGKTVGVQRVVPTFSGLVTLVDADFRLLIKVKILQNNSGSSLFDIQSLIKIYFPTSLKVFDYANMHMSYFFDSTFGSVQLAEAFVRLGLLPKPMGVQLGALIYAPNIHNFFGFRRYNVPPFDVHGFNTYSVYDTDAPWLTYAYALSF